MAADLQKRAVWRAPWHELAVAAFVTHTRVTSVAKALGLSRATITRWKGIRSNWSEVRAARSQVVARVIAQAAQNASSRRGSIGPTFLTSPTEVHAGD